MKFMFNTTKSFQDRTPCMDGPLMPGWVALGDELASGGPNESTLLSNALKEFVCVDIESKKLDVN